MRFPKDTRAQIQEAEPFFPPPTFDEVPDTGRIRVTKPNAEAGEIIVRGVSPGHFRAKLPRAPKLRPIPVDDCAPSARGWEVLRMYDYREQQIVFYEAHRLCLTRQEKSALANGRSHSVLRPIEIKPEWRIGDRFEVANNVEAEIVDLAESFRGHGTVFKIHDHRSWFMKSTMGATGTPVVDEHGFPVPLTPAELERSRIDGAYTRSASEGLSGAGDVLDDKLYQRLHGEASMKQALGQAQGKQRVTIARLEQRLEEARQKHWSTGHIERNLDRLRGKKARRDGDGVRTIPYKM